MVDWSGVERSGVKGTGDKWSKVEWSGVQWLPDCLVPLEFNALFVSLLKLLSSFSLYFSDVFFLPNPINVFYTVKLFSHGWFAVLRQQKEKS